MTTPNDPELINRVIDLRNSKLPDGGQRSYTTIAEALTIEYGLNPNNRITKDQVRGIYQRHYTTNDETPEETERPAPGTDVIRTFLQTTLDYSSFLPHKPVDSILRKVVALGDIHSSPDPALQRMIIDEQPDLIFMGGDLLDSKEVSRHEWNPNDLQMSLQEEIQVNRAYIETYLLNTRADIEIIPGNHDRWAMRKIAELIPPSIMFLVRDPLDLVVYDLPRTNLVKQPIHAINPRAGIETDLGYTEFMHLVGDDALMSHADFTAKQPGASVKKLYEWVRDHRRFVGWGDINLLVQFHTHKQSLNVYEGGFVYCVEPGIAGTHNVDRYHYSYSAKWSPCPISALCFQQELTASGSWQTIRSTVRFLQPYR